MFIKLSGWLSSIFLTFLLISFFAANSSGLSVSHSYNGGSGSISDSQNYNLDALTAMKSTSIFEGGSMQQTIQADGKGQNSLGQQIKGNLYSSENTLSSSGSFGVSSSTVASSTVASTGQSVSSSGESTLGQSVTGEGYSLQNFVTSSGLLSHSGSISASADDGNMNQQLVGEGNVALTMNGIKGEDNSGQKASVEAGLMASDQSISAGQGVSSSQSTAINGEAGSLGSGALSSDNTMLVTGSFDGSGSLNAELNTGASGEVSAHGKVSVNGGTLIDDSTIQSVGKDSVGLSKEGLTASPDGSTGSFSASVVNMNQANSKLAGTGGVAAAQAQTGYNLMMYNSIPMKWTQTNPQVQLYLVGSSVAGTLNQVNVQSAISTAANTWDNVAGQNLFADGSTVKIDNTKQIVPADGKSTVGANTQGWRTLSSNENPNGNTLAVTYNWFNGPSGGYYSITESDTAFNNAISWSTAGGTYDVQSVSLHELGHTIGLGHISDTNQIMNPSYTGKRSLGSGDIAGAQFLYGGGSSTWSGFSGLGGVLTSDPHMIIDAQGRTNIFVRGTDNALYDNLDGNWIGLGGQLTSDPIPTVDSQGRVHVFYADQNHALADKIVGGSTLNLGGYITSNPAVAINGNNLQLGVKGIDNALYTQSINTQTLAGSGWSGLGGILTSNPNLAYDSHGTLHAFVRGNDYAMYENMGGSWFYRGGYLTSDPIPIKDPISQNVIKNFVRGYDGALYMNSLDTQTMSSGWSGLGGSILPVSSNNPIYNGNPALAADMSGYIYSFNLANDKTINYNAKGVWTNLGSSGTSDLSALSATTKNPLQIAVRGPDNALYINKAS